VLCPLTAPAGLAGHVPVKEFGALPVRREQPSHIHQIKKATIVPICDVYVSICDDICFLKISHLAKAQGW
jgi:hypothetical protein